MMRPGILLALLPLALHAGLDPKVDAGSATPLASWKGDGASLYRVAVFAPADKEGKKPLLAAAWVKGTKWSYGDRKSTLAKVGNLSTTDAKPLEPGTEYSLWVRPAKADGSYSADWSISRFKLGSTPPSSRQALTEIPSPTSTPTPRAEAAGNSLDAELEVDLAGDFKETPETAETLKVATPTPVLTPSFESARELLRQGQPEAAEAVYKALLDADARSADAWEGLGDSYDARKMKVEAKEAYEKALELDKKRERLSKWLEEHVRK